VIFLIPLGGRTLLQGASDSWVLTEYRVSGAANNAKWGIGAVAGNKFTCAVSFSVAHAFSRASA